MKKLYTVIAGILLTASVFAQAPEKMSYQAVVRDGSNSLTTNQAVGMQISILQGSATGTPVYVETQTPTTNANGLVSLEIGTGTVVSGDFTTIDWTNGTYFIKTETDPTGGTSYTITGTTQLMSVPYALHAKTAESITGTVNYTETDPIYTTSEAANITAAHITVLGNTSGTNTGDQTVITAAQATAITVNTAKVGVTTAQATILGNTSGTNTGDQDGSETKVTAGTNVTITGTGTTASPYVVNATSGSSGHYVGELFGGGIVYYVYNNGTNGLIASLDDLDGGSGVAWSGNTSTLIGATAQNMINGTSNTAAMVAQSSTANKAGTLCNSYAGGGFTDWYLPSNRELYLLASQDILIDQILDNDGNGATNGFSQEYIAPTYGRYWSSTEITNNSAWYYGFNVGYSGSNGKILTYRVRAVRAF